MLVLVFFAFLAGAVTILSPCILPVLPIVLSSSLTGGKKRPLGVVSGFIVSFTFFTLALTAIVRATGVSPDFLRNMAVAVILIFGISLLLPKFQITLEKLFSKIASVAPQGKTSGGFGGGLLVGLSLGLLWTPCVGPILASIIALAVTSSVTFDAVLITLAYSIGTALPMLLIIYGGRRLLEKAPFLVRHTGAIQKFFGIVMVVVAVMIFFNWHLRFQAYILQKFPNYGANLTQLEDVDIVRKQLEKRNMMKENREVDSDLITCKSPWGRAPDFTGGGNWLNSEPLKMSALRGKVVLVDFWTYTCINCIRTLPFINGWHEKYADDGLVIVGVHTPEFEFEKSLKNVQRAVDDFKIKYPVVQDNDYAIWRSYANRYWPAKYFVDKTGCIRWAHFGEGQYQESEEWIKDLLAETGAKVGEDYLDIEEYSGAARTPETYLGYMRIEHFASPEPIVPNSFSLYTLPENLPEHFLAYGGEWKLEDEKALPKTGAVLQFNVVAKEIYLVMRANGEKGRVKVYLDGKIIGSELSGDDVKNGIVEVTADRLYRLVKLPVYGRHVLKLEFLDDNVEAFAFTFG